MRFQNKPDDLRIQIIVFFNLTTFNQKNNFIVFSSEIIRIN